MKKSRAIVFDFPFSFRHIFAAKMKYFTPFWSADILRKILQFIYSVYTKNNARFVVPVAEYTRPIIAA